MEKIVFEFKLYVTNPKWIEVLKAMPQCIELPDIESGKLALMRMTSHDLRDWLIEPTHVYDIHHRIMLRGLWAFKQLCSAQRIFDRGEIKFEDYLDPSIDGIYNTDVRSPCIATGNWVKK